MSEPTPSSPIGSFSLGGAAAEMTSSFIRNGLALTFEEGGN